MKNVLVGEPDGGGRRLLERLLAGSTSGDPKGRYCGGVGDVADDESALTYVKARYYDQADGRFLSQDPGRQDYNWNIYCNNDPVNRIDANGKMPQLIATFLAGFIVGLFYSLVDQIYNNGLNGVSVEELFRSAFIGGVIGFALAAGGLYFVAQGGALAQFGEGLLAISTATSAKGLAGALGYAAGGAGSAVINILCRNIQIMALLKEMGSDPIYDGGY